VVLVVLVVVEVVVVVLVLVVLVVLVVGGVTGLGRRRTEASSTVPVDGEQAAATTTNPSPRAPRTTDVLLRERMVGSGRWIDDESVSALPAVTIGENSKSLEPGSAQRTFRTGEAFLQVPRGTR
jgi:hypothetical protein